MKQKTKNFQQIVKNILTILRDKRHEQKSKALSFALMYSILPTLVLVNLTITFLPKSFFEMLESSIELLPTQYQGFVQNFITEYTYQDYNIVLYIFLLLFILYTISTNVRLLIEIANDCYEYSAERSKNKELVISVILFILLSFTVVFVFAIVIAGRALRSFLDLNAMSTAAGLISTILQMKSILTITMFILIFFIIYYFAPNVKSTFKSTIVGTLLSSFGLYIASRYFEIYLSRPTNTYEYLYQNYSLYLIFLFGMYVVCQIIVASLIINSLIFEEISVREYHLINKEIPDENINVQVE